MSSAPIQLQSKETWPVQHWTWKEHKWPYDTGLVMYQHNANAENPSAHKKRRKHIQQWARLWSFYTNNAAKKCIKMLSNQPIAFWRRETYKWWENTLKHPATEDLQGVKVLPQSVRFLRDRVCRWFPFQTESMKGKTNSYKKKLSHVRMTYKKDKKSNMLPLANY